MKKNYGLISWILIIFWLVIYLFPFNNNEFLSIIYAILFFVIPIVAFIFSMKNYRRSRDIKTVMNLIISILLFIFILWSLFFGIFILD
jgi:heme A synthase